MKTTIGDEFKAVLAKAAKTVMARAMALSPITLNRKELEAELPQQDAASLAANIEHFIDSAVGQWKTLDGRDMTRKEISDQVWTYVWSKVKGIVR